jgi:nucleoside 2-deoxyribosyltransferase
MLRFLGLKHPSISDAYQWDINCVRRCDVLVADLTHPSLGLGMELGVAIESRKPIIMLANDQLALPRLLAWGSWDPLHFKLRYQTREEAAEFAIARIRELFPSG